MDFVIKLFKSVFVISFLTILVIGTFMVLVATDVICFDGSLQLARKMYGALPLVSIVTIFSLIVAEITDYCRWRR